MRSSVSPWLPIVAASQHGWRVWGTVIRGQFGMRGAKLAQKPFRHGSRGEMIKEVIQKILILCVCFVASVFLLAHEASVGYLSTSQMQKLLILLMCATVALIWVIIIRVASRHKANQMNRDRSI
jgi:hypothetical protein